MTRRGAARSGDPPASEKQAAKAVADCVSEVARKHKNCKDSTIRQALMWEMERRGLGNLKPDEELGRRVRMHTG